MTLVDHTFNAEAHPSRTEARSSREGQSRALRIASCINSVSVSGGSELNAVRTAEQLTRRGHEVVAITLTDDRGGMAERYRAAGIEVHGFPVSSLVGFGAIAQVRRASRFFRERGIEIVHTHDCYTNFLMVPAARLASVPVLASKRWVFQTFPQHRVTDRIAYHLADAVLANSAEVARTVERVERIPASRVHVVPNFVDDAVFQARADRTAWRQRFGADCDDVVFMIVAKLRPEKNHLLLLRAFSRVLQLVPQSRLVVVGNGPERDSIAATANSLGVAERLQLVGHIDQAWRAFAAADIAVLPSKHEGFPNSLIEAMAAGVPVIASNVGGIPDAVVHGENGLLVPVDDEDALTEALTRLALDRVERDALGQAAQAAMGAYRADNVLQELERLYASLLRARA